MGESIHGYPGPNPGWMFGFTIPDARERDESWGHGAFTETEEESDGCEAGVGFWCCETHAYATPDDSFKTSGLVDVLIWDLGCSHGYASEFGKGKSGHEVDEWVFGH